MKKIISISEAIKKLLELSQTHKNIEIECIEKNVAITFCAKKPLSFEEKKKKIIKQMGNGIKYFSNGEMKIANLVEEVENNCFKVTEILSSNDDEFHSFEIVNIDDIKALAHYNCWTEKYEFEEFIENIKL